MIKKTLIGLCVFMMVAGLVVATIEANNDLWLNDFDKAKLEAQETGLPIFLLFTGGNWCSFCLWLDARILSKVYFKNYAKENLILLKADLAADEDKRTEAVKNLMKRYDIANIPVIILTKATGQEFKRIELDDIMAGRDKPKSFVKYLKEVIVPPATD